MREPKQIDIRYYQKMSAADREMAEVWVINRTAQNRQQPGNVSLTVTANGSEVAIMIPSTWIPIALTDDVSTVDLLGAPQFRTALKKGFFTLHDPEECEKFMETEDAKAEFKRINKITDLTENSIQKQIETGDVEINDGEGNKLKAMDANTRIKTVEQAQAAGDSEAVGVLNLVVQAFVDDMEDAQRMNYLRTNAPKFVKKDYDYIIKLSKNTNIQRWAITAREDYIKEKKKQNAQAE